MTFSLRPYQQEAVERTIVHFRKSNEPAVIVLPTGAGKSLVIAELAKLARGKILVLAHVKELVEQNLQKYESYGFKASVFSAGLKQKSLERQVTFASIQSISRNLSLLNESYSLVIIDECHRVSSDSEGQYQQVIAQLKHHNAQLKVLGLTATPYRLGLGFIYQQHYHGFVRGDDSTPFKRCIYELPLGYMIKHHYLTKPIVQDAAIAHYDFASLTSNAFGQYAQADLNKLLQQETRATKAIINDVLSHAKTRQGVMIFAATVDHAKEILGYLPEQESALVVAETPAVERDNIIARFKQKHIKYLVNVAVLTTGFDAPHVDFIAILRPTESVSLYQQIVGRGLRLANNKTDCLIIDYAGNGYDLFYPEVGSKKPAPDTEPVQVLCPGCGFANMFWGRTDSDGRVTEHFGRRCQGLLEDDDESIQCDFRFRFKQCPSCNHENDIAARRCQSCDTQLIDPDSKLKDALNLKDAMVIRCTGISFEQLTSSSFKLIYHDEDGAELSERFNWQHQSVRELFSLQFVAREKQLVLSTVNDVSVHVHELKVPDFVIARKQKHYWQVVDKLFDYEGKYRKANAL